MALRSRLVAEDYAALLSRLRHDLDEVDAAMRRVEDGTYGKCEVCGSVLEEQCLAAHPIERYCLACSGPGAARG